MRRKVSQWEYRRRRAVATLIRLNRDLMTWQQKCSQAASRVVQHEEKLRLAQAQVATLQQNINFETALLENAIRHVENETSN